MSKYWRYERTGLLALAPMAMFALVPEEVPVRCNRSEAGGCITVVEIRGPLTHHNEKCLDSYDCILDRVAEACAGTAHTILMSIDSPGGDATGCFDASQEIRARCKAAGKRLVTFIDGHACSAAYALACAADIIVVTDSGFAGSVGVIDMRADITAINKAQGIRLEVITSGSRKADGNPNTPITDAELVESQARVDELATVFFNLVSEHRNLGAEAIKGLEARIFCGQSAVKAGLADRVQTYDGLLASLASPNGANMATMKDARAALAAVAEGDDKEEAAVAKKALAAMSVEITEEPADEEEGDEEASADEDEPEAAAATAGATKTVSATTAAAAAAVSTDLSARLARLEAKNESEGRTTFLATRPDLAPELVAVLATKPLDEVKALVNAMPKPKKKVAAQAITTTLATRGVGQGGEGGVASPDSIDMDQRMGLSATKIGARKEGNSLIFGIMKTSEGAAK